MSSTEPRRFEQSFTVDEADIDELGHVNNVVYLRWVQDVATAHWMEATTPAQRAGIAWVVARHEIDYRAPALRGDELTARTWVAAWTGVRSERHTEIVRHRDGTVLARARTIWGAVDPESGRPRRLEAGVRERF